MRPFSARPCPSPFLSRAIPGSASSIQPTVNPRPGSATEAMSDSGIRKRYGESSVRTRFAVHLVPYVVYACMAFGFWMATLRHKAGTAQAHARQYAQGIVDAAQGRL